MMARSVTTYLRFGSGDQVYYFPPTTTKFTDNFLKLRTLSEILPGMDGAHDPYGYGAAPRQNGLVEVKMWLLADYPAQMTVLKDGLSAIAGWGKQRLYKQPFDTTKRERWCNARVQDIRWQDDAEQTTWRSQEVILMFEVPEARWFSRTADNLPLWGTEYNWGQVGLLWGGGAGTAYSGASSPLTISITSNGTALSAPLIALTCSASQVMTNPVIERVVNSEVVERIKFNGTVGNSQLMVLDCRALRAKLNGLDIYDNVDIQRSSWLTIAPGANTFRLSSDSAGDACTVQIQFDEAYYA